MTQQAMKCDLKITIRYEESNEYELHVNNREGTVKAYLKTENDELYCYQQFNLYNDNNVKRSEQEIIGVARAFLESEFKHRRQEFIGSEVDTN